MSFLTHFEVGSVCKEFERKGFFECSVFFCKHCSSSISQNNKSFLNLATHHKVNKYENCLITVYIPQIIFTDNNIAEAVDPLPVEQSKQMENRSR